MNATKVNAFLASFAAPEGEEGAAKLLTAAAEAFGFRSDAELARMLDLPPATLASWRRRGTVPARSLETLRERLIPQVVAVWRDRLPQGGDLPRAAAIHLILKAGPHPLQAAHMLGPLIALAGLMLRLRPELSPEDDDLVIDTISGVLEPALPLLRASVG